MAAPFLYGTATEMRVKVDENDFGSENETTISVPLTIEDRRNSLAVPFAIAGIIQALGE